MKILERSFDWGMGDGKGRYILGDLNKKESNLRSSINRICKNIWNLSKGQRNSYGVNVLLVFYSLIV